MLTTAQREFLNTNAPAGFPLQLGNILHHTTGCIKATYDFSVLGGAVGDISLKTASGETAQLPAGSFGVRSFVLVETAPTSAGSATIAFKSLSAADIYAATAYGSVTGLLQGKQDNLVANALIAATATDIKITIGTAALTAGKIHVYIEYLLK